MPSRSRSRSPSIASRGSHRHHGADTYSNRRPSQPSQSPRRRLSRSPSPRHARSRTRSRSRSPPPRRARSPQNHRRSYSRDRSASPARDGRDRRNGNRGVRYRSLGQGREVHILRAAAAVVAALSETVDRAVEAIPEALLPPLEGVQRYRLFSPVICSLGAQTC